MKTRMLVVSMIAAVVAMTSATLASGVKPPPRPVKFSAALNVGQVRPHPKGTKVGASGRFTATLTGTTLHWRLTYIHLSGAATAAHIHLGVRGVNGGILIPLCTVAPCISPLTGTTAVTPDQIADLKARRTYVNVHTARNPGGEIRGQITRAL